MPEKHFNEILRYEKRIHQFFKSHQLTTEEAEDLKQEALCRVYESISRFRGTSSLGTWIYGICRNVLYEHRRKNTRTVPILEYEIPVPDKTDYIDFTSLVDSLPDYLKPVYDRRFRMDMKIREIARQLSMPEGSVKYYIFLIKKHLRNMV